MKEYIKERVLEEAKYIIESGASFKKAHKLFGISESTIRKDINQRLPLIDMGLAVKVKGAKNNLSDLKNRVKARKKTHSTKPQNDNCIKVINNNFADLEHEVYSNIDRTKDIDKISNKLPLSTGKDNMTKLDRNNPDDVEWYTEEEEGK